MNANSLLGDEDRQMIESRIREIEKSCALQVVCACSTESGRYDRAESICGIIFSVLILSLANYAAFYLRSEPGSWATVQIHLGWQVLAVVLGFIIGTVLASYVHWIRRLFVGDSMLAEEVDRAAELVVRLSGIGQASQVPGLLIYVSCFEHRIVIRVNEKLNDAISQDLMDRACQDAKTRLKKMDLAKAFLSVIDRISSELLESGECRPDSDLNPLPNHVLVFHPRPA